MIRSRTSMRVVMLFIGGHLGLSLKGFMEP